MANHYLPWNPTQVALMPVDPSEWLDDDHMAYQLLEVMQHIDMSQFGRRGALDGRGAPGYDPGLLTVLVLYCLLHGQVSSRAMARFCRNDLGARMLCGPGGPPQYRCLAKFRQRNRKTMEHLFAQTVRLCQAAKLVDITMVFVDGSKFKANASPRTNMTCAQIEAETERLEKQFHHLFDEADSLDKAEDQQPPDEQGPGAKSKRAEWRESLAAAKERMDEDARAKKAQWDATPPSERPHDKAPTGVPENGCRVNLTDPDSRLMKFPDGGYRQGYNANVAVEAKHQIIVGTSLSSDSNDYHQLKPAVESVRQIAGGTPGTCTADGGYMSAANVNYLGEQHIEAVICPTRRLPAAEQPATDVRDDSGGVCDGRLSAKAAKDKMTAVVSSARGRHIYSMRKYKVEPVFGQIKGGPGRPGILGFVTRGLENCRAEWLLYCCVHNLGKYMRFKNGKPPKPAHERGCRTVKLPRLSQMVMELAPI